MREHILIGQPRQRRKRYSVKDDPEDKERQGARYMDEPRKELYLPKSVHGSRRHMSGLARNALVLVLKYGCLNVFLTLTCNPDWHEIRSQLIHCQTAFDCLDVTVPVFKSRLDQIKTNIRNGKYFQSRQDTCIFHII
jgi:hypothetical protein